MRGGCAAFIHGKIPRHSPSRRSRSPRWTPDHHQYCFVCHIQNGPVVLNIQQYKRNSLLPSPAHPLAPTGTYKDRVQLRGTMTIELYTRFKLQDNSLQANRIEYSNRAAAYEDRVTVQSDSYYARLVVLLVYQ